MINAQLITGLSKPTGLAVAGNTLYAGTVGSYNVNTGAAINANLITGLNAPSGLAATGNLRFVSNEIGGTVDKYTISGDSKTATFIKSITGLNGPTGLVVPSKGSAQLFVADTFSGTVALCDTNSGTVVTANFISGLSLPGGLAIKNAK